ncbi:hypothetical protein LEP1GSC037_3658 [Leptospira interrogans str. 2006001854]|uniref:Uncharacterized protein n=1 Tax=Leptospira interrogans str. 2006001854 TaxID=1001590 RepID=M6GZ04_LEPIR|nr:hypothetical protein LEP1GSC037_3658 [Leptospira interrogans str. 2006001854]
MDLFIPFTWILFLDRVLFPIALFEFPNELEWDTSPWYNFLHKRKTFILKKMKREFS